MDYVYCTIITIVLLAMAAYTTVGFWYLCIIIKNYAYIFGKSLNVNDKAHIFEAGNEKEY